jgi:hypothetical protein
MQEVELYHHGIKGQKWGVRRFQKLNGTLTQLGKKVRQEINSREEFASAKNNWQRPTQPTDYHKRPDRYTFMRGEKAMAPVGMGWADSRNYKKYDAEYNAHPFTTGDGTSRNKPYNAKSYAEAGKYANEYVKNSHASNASLSPYAKAANAIGATASVIKKSVGQEISDRRQFDQLKNGYQTPSSFSRTSNDMAGAYGSLYANRNKNQQQRDIMGAEITKARTGQQSQPLGKPTSYGDAISKPTFFTDSNGVKKERLDDKSERDILAARTRMNSEEYKRKDAELRKGYEFAKHRKDLDNPDNNYSFDDYVRKHDPQEYNRRYNDAQALAKDRNRTWHNGQASANELYRREEATRESRQKAYSDSLRKAQAGRDAFDSLQFSRMSNAAASLPGSNSMQSLYRSNASSISRSSQQAYKSATSSMSLGKSQAAYNSAVSRASSLFSTGSDRTRMSRATYNRSVSQITSAAKSKVSAYATKARTNAGKAFTNYMTKMAEASKMIDSDLWSF